MKIIGFTSFDGEKPQILLKGDSCMLVNRKPFFTPDGPTDMQALPCIVLRVSRLGKSILARFADRYFDVFAYGYDIFAKDKLIQAQQAGQTWSEATCFDYSLVVGEWQLKDFLPTENLCVSPEEAIVRASRLMTIRQGDLIYIHTHAPARKLTRDEVLTGPEGFEESVYCKIK